MVAPRRVFLSHTSEFENYPSDMSYVLAAINAVAAAGHVATDMRNFPARDEEAGSVCVDRVAEHDVYVGIIGFRYGTPVKDRSELSYTELEFEAATKNHIPRLVFLLAESATQTTPGMVVDGQYGARQLAFRQRLLDDRLVVGHFQDVSDLEKQIERALRALGDEHLRHGREAVDSRLELDSALGSWLGRPGSLCSQLVGRSRELKTLKTWRRAGRHLVLAGMAGTGKSRLATEFTWQEASRGLWSNAGETVDQTLAAVAPNIGVASQTDAKTAVAVERLLGTMPDEVLWVIDNLPSLGQWAELTRRCGRVKLLATTRDLRRELVGDGAFLMLESLDEAPAMELLRSRGYTGLDNESLRELADVVGHLPMALESLAVQLARSFYPEAATRVLEQIRSAAHALALSLFRNAGGTTIERADGVLAALAGGLGRVRPESRRHIAPLGYLADAPIPVAFLSAVVNLAGDELTELVSECRREAILVQAVGEVRVHRLMMAAIQATNVETDLETLYERASVRLTSINLGEPRAMRAELAHHEHVLSVITQLWTDRTPRTLRYRLRLANGYRTLGRHEEAVALDEHTLRLRERLLGPEHPDTLISRNNLASGYGAVGRHEEAVALDEDTLCLRERVLGPEHPDTLMSRNNLASGYDVVGRHEEALALDEDTLRLRKDVLGPEHPDTLMSRNNLAIGYRAVGRHEEALALDEDTLRLRKDVLGPEHPDTLMSRNNLASSYRAVGRREEAVALDEDTLRLRERILGPKHPDTLMSRNNLASGYRAVGRHKEAVALDEDTVRLREQVLGPAHPKTLTSRHHLALGYRAVGRDEEAVALDEGTLRLREQVPDPRHPESIDTLPPRGDRGRDTP